MKWARRCRHTSQPICRLCRTCQLKRNCGMFRIRRLCGLRRVKRSLVQIAYIYNWHSQPRGWVPLVRCLSDLAITGCILLMPNGSLKMLASGWIVARRGRSMHDQSLGTWCGKDQGAWAAASFWLPTHSHRVAAGATLAVFRNGIKSRVGRNLERPARPINRAGRSWQDYRCGLSRGSAQDLPSSMRGSLAVSRRFFGCMARIVVF